MHRLRRDLTYTLPSGVTPLTILMQSFMISCITVSAVTILRLSRCSNLSAIAWQASYEIENNHNSITITEVNDIWYNNPNSNTYHCMSRLLHIRRGICRCYYWCHWDLRDIWLHKCVIMRQRWMSRRICRLCRCHERMRNEEEPVHVIGCTLSWHNTNLTRWCKMVWVVHPPVVNFFKWHASTYSRCRNTLHVSKLVHDPLWSVSHDNEHPS